MPARAEARQRADARPASRLGSAPPHTLLARRSARRSGGKDAPDGRRRAVQRHGEAPGGRHSRARHLTVQEIADSLALSDEESEERPLLHLLETCAVCRRRYAEYRTLERQARHFQPRVIVVETRASDALWQELQGLSGAERMRRVLAEERFHLWSFCRLLQRLSLETSVDQPAEALALADLALALWPKLASAYDADWLEDLRAGALGCRANARRALGRHAAAEADFNQAYEALGSGTGSAVANADLSLLLALQRSDQGEWGQALALLDGAYQNYLREPPAGGDREGAAKALAMKGCLLHQLGRDEAAAALQQAAELAEPDDCEDRA